MYGTALPYGKAGFSNLAVDMFVRQAGGDIVAPDNTPAFSGPGTIKALEFLKEARRYCPPGANNNSFGETLSAFTSGGTAIGMYTGRTLVEVETRNPSIKDKINAAPYAYARDGVAWWMSAPRKPCMANATFQSPARTKASPSATRRAAAMSSAQVRSAVVSSRTPGVLVTRMPRFVAAATSTLL